MEKCRRKKFLINKNMQLRMVLINIVLMIFITLLIGSGIYFSIWKSVTKEFSDVKLAEDFEAMTRMREYEGVRQRRTIEVLPAVREEAKMLSEQQKSVLNRIIVKSNTNLIPVLVFSCMVIFIAGIVYTNRLAGPVYRIMENLKEVENGRLLQDFKLRSKDEFRDLAVSIEKVVMTFSGTIKKSKDLIDNIKIAATDEERKKIIEQLEETYNKFEV